LLAPSSPRGRPTWFRRLRAGWTSSQACWKGTGSASGKARKKSLLRCGTRWWRSRSEEHTSELQSRENLVCRLLLEKKKSIRDSMPAKIHDRQMEAKFYTNVL